jgi:hypothetical protein
MKNGKQTRYPLPCSRRACSPFGVNGEQARRLHANLVLAIWIIPFAILFFAFAVPARAQSNQDDVLRAISDNVNDTVDTGKLAAVAAIVVAIVIVLAVVSQMRKRSVTPKTLNHQGKLIKEVAKSIHLKPGEIKQLKILSEEKELTSPLVLLLCPSLLAQAVKDNPGKVDRQTIMSVARKITAH